MSLRQKQKTTFQSPKGTRDILPKDYVFYQNVFEKAEEIAEYYGFKPIQTPHFEHTALFTASLGETSDVIEKQMYSFKAKGGDSLTLRPEGTASVARAYIEHGMHTLPQPIMLWYKGSFFRHESPQRGRFREFQQFGMEIIGEERAIAEATIIQAMSLILNELGIKSLSVRVNSIGDKECAGNYRKNLTAYYRKKTKDLCSDCQRRLKTNPLRLLDCKNPGCAAIKEEAPQSIEYLCGSCKQHLKTVLESLDVNNIPYLLDNNLVRGFDYYSRTVFEIFEEKANGNKPTGQEVSSEETIEVPALTSSAPAEQIKKQEEGFGAPLTLAAGGRYDYLLKILGKRDTPAAGGGIGIDRVVECMKNDGIKLKNKKMPKVFLIQLGTAAKYKSLSIIEMLRKAHIPLVQSISKDSIKGQLNMAAKMQIPYVLILGQQEILENSIIVRNMESREQETVPVEKVVDVLKDKLR